MAACRVHQLVSLQGFVQQDVQPRTPTGQEMLRGAVTAHGNGRDGAGTMGIKSRGMHQLKPDTVRELKIEQQQVVGALGQERPCPAQTAGFLDDAVGPGVLKNRAGAHPVHGLVVNDEQTWGGRRVHDGFRRQ